MTYQPRQCFESAVTAPEIERLIYHMPAIAQQDGSEWAKGFAASVVRQARRRGWKPSQKQLQLMRSLVSDLFAHQGQEEGDFSLIE